MRRHARPRLEVRQQHVLSAGRSAYYPLTLPLTGVVNVNEGGHGTARRFITLG